jgi:beta-lactamase regulating signal transducer with metallopeptidase domain
MAAAEHAALAFVLNATWQVPLVVGAGALLVRAMRRAPTRTRHQVWTVVLLVAVIAPGLGTFGFGRALRPLPTTAMNAPGTGNGSIVAPAAGPAGLPGLHDGSAAPSAARHMGPDGFWDRAASLRDSAAQRAPIGVLALLLLLIPALLGCLRLTRSLLRARALRRSAVPPAAGDRVILLADSTRAALGLGPVALLVTDEAIAPATIGILRPAILLPRSLLRDARDAELRAVLAHEMAHVARCDAARQVLAETALLPLRFHPVVPLLRRRLVETRELACDEAAAGAAGGARAYARALLDVSAILSGLSRPLTLPGVLGAGLLEVRMRHLTGSSTPWGRMRARLSLALATLALVALAGTAIPFAIGGTDAPPAAPEAPPAPVAPEAQPAPAPPAPPAPPAGEPAPTPPVTPAPASAPTPPAPPERSAPPAPPAPPAPAAPTATPAPAPVDAPAPSMSDWDVTIKIRSAVSGREVEVEGVYVFAPEGSRLHYVKQRTPFEIRTTARLLDGIFSSTSEEATIRVEMKAEGGRRDRATAMATGRSVTLHTDDRSSGWRIAGL